MLKKREIAKMKLKEAEKYSKEADEKVDHQPGENFSSLYTDEDSHGSDHHHSSASIESESQSNGSESHESGESIPQTKKMASNPEKPKEISEKEIEQKIIADLEKDNSPVERVVEIVFGKRKYITIDKFSLFLFRAFSNEPCKVRVDELISKDGVRFSIYDILHDLALLRNVYVNPKSLHREPQHRMWRLVINLLLPVMRFSSDDCTENEDCPLLKVTQPYSLVFNPSVWNEYLLRISYESMDGIAKFLNPQTPNLDNLQSYCQEQQFFIPSSMISFFSVLYYDMDKSSVARSLIQSTGGPLQRAFWGGQSAKILSLVLHPTMRYGDKVNFPRYGNDLLNFLRADRWDYTKTLLYIIAGTLLPAHYSLNDCQSSPIYNMLFLANSVSEGQIIAFSNFQTKYFPQGCDISDGLMGKSVSRHVEELLRVFYDEDRIIVNKQLIALMVSLVIPSHLLELLQGEEGLKEVTVGANSMPEISTYETQIVMVKYEIGQYLYDLEKVWRILYNIEGEQLNGNNLFSMAYVITMIHAMTLDQVIVDEHTNAIIDKEEESNRIPPGFDFHKSLMSCKSLILENDPWVGRMLGLYNGFTTHPGIHYHPIFSYTVAKSFGNLIQILSTSNPHRPVVPLEDIQKTDEESDQNKPVETKDVNEQGPEELIDGTRQD